MGGSQLTPKTANPFGVTKVGGLRVFSNEKLQNAIDMAVADAGDAPFVVVAHHEFDQHGAENTNVTKLSVVGKTADGEWTVVAGAFKDWTSGDLGAGAKVVWKPF